MKYTIKSESTGMRAYPIKVSIVGDIPAGMHQKIYDWLHQHKIKYEFGSGQHWYFKDDQDAVTFKLRWSYYGGGN